MVPYIAELTYDLLYCWNVGDEEGRRHVLSA